MSDIKATEIGEVYEFPDSWECIASMDESEAYEVDRTEIHFDTETKTFVLATASGCSCWDGDYWAVRYDTVEDLLTDIGPAGTADYEYMPSFEGVGNLRKQVEEWQSK